MSVEFNFNPEAPGTSPGLSSYLERVFGAARWAHNRAMITQWEAIRKGDEPPGLNALIADCIDGPAREAETDWLNFAPRDVMIDELRDLVVDPEYLADIKTFRALPLKKKKEDQEIIYPVGSYRFTDGQQNASSSPSFSPMFNGGYILWLDQTGFMPIDSLILEKIVDTDDIKIERSVQFKYTATIYYWDD